MERETSLLKAERGPALTVSRFIADLRPPDEIRYGEVITFWTPIPVRLWCNGYTVYISPNKALQAWTNDTMQMIALLWDRYTGELHQVNGEALYELMKALGGWI